LFSYIIKEHPKFLQLGDKLNSNISVLDAFWPKKALNIHAWMSIVIKSLLPFSFVEDEMARKCMRPEAIFLKMLMKYMHDNYLDQKMVAEDFCELLYTH
jgi:hypothetical protein